MVHYFLAGGALMWPLLALFVIGCIIVIFKFWILARSKINTRKFMEELTRLVEENKIDEAIKLCEKTRGPIAATLHSGLTRIDMGLNVMERAMENTAAIELSFLEKGMVWLATIISIAPMIGFLGTVQGMIIAFDRVAKSNDIIPTEVAYGISVALLTTFGGLSIAIPFQACYNYFVNRVESMVIEMEDSANTFIETLLTKKLIKKEQ